MKKRIISIDIAITSYKDALVLILNNAKNKNSSYFCFTNAHMIIEAVENKTFQNFVNKSTASFSDGVPIAKACTILHKIRQERIAGMDVFPDLLSIAEKENIGIFLFGGEQKVLDNISNRIKKEHSQLTISGSISPPFGKEWNNEQFIKEINNSNAGICFVALGCPKQEIWMANYSNLINMPLLGVGGAFPVYAQTQKRCPKWMANNGLEWLYRLYQEPKRLLKRYLITNSKFIFYLLKQKLLGKYE